MADHIQSPPPHYDDVFPAPPIPANLRRSPSPRPRTSVTAPEDASPPSLTPTRGIPDPPPPTLTLAASPRDRRSRSPSLRRSRTPSRGSSPVAFAIEDPELKLLTDGKGRGRISDVKIDKNAEEEQYFYIQIDQVPTVTRYDLSGVPVISFGTGSGGMSFVSDEYDVTCMIVANRNVITRTLTDGRPFTLPTMYDRVLKLEGDYDLVSIATLQKEDKAKYAAIDFLSGKVLIIEPIPGFVKRSFSVGKGDYFEARRIATNQALKGLVAVSGLHSNQVRLYSKKGEIADIIGCYGYGDDKMKSPAGLCIDDDGRIWVCDHGNGRVIRFTKVAKERWEGKCVISPEMLDNRRPCHVDVSSSGHVILSAQSQFGEHWWMLFKIIGPK